VAAAGGSVADDHGLVADDHGLVAGVTEEAPRIVRCADEVPPPPPPGDRPPEAGPGEAWCRVWVPAENEMVSERVLVAPARKIKRWIAPVYAKRMRVECDGPAEIREVTVPAQYGTRRRTVTTSQARNVWERVRCGGDGCTCQECWKKETRPAVTEEVCERVCLEPSRTTLEFKPAAWRVVEEDYILEPGRCEEVCVPARYENRVRTVCKKPGRWEWRRNPDCEVPAVASLPALQVELIDQLPDHTEAGIFSRGETVRYELRLTHDEGSQAMADLGVRFELPPELEFISGKGVNAELEVTGEGQAASTAMFTLEIGQVRTIELMARVIGVPATNLVQLVASVHAPDGSELARETESTTLREPRVHPTAAR
jgi:hypothetical protein